MHYSNYRMPCEFRMYTVKEKNTFLDFSSLNLPDSVPLSNIPLNSATFTNLSFFDALFLNVSTKEKLFCIYILQIFTLLWTRSTTEQNQVGNNSHRGINKVYNQFCIYLLQIFTLLWTRSTAEQNQVGNSSHRGINIAYDHFVIM